MNQMTFLKSVTDLIIENLGDYHDTVRDESQALLIFITERFLPPTLNID